MMMALRHNPGVARPKGGTGTLTQALVKMVEHYGGTILCDRTAGWLHMVLNVAALLLSLVNFFLRFGSPNTMILPFGLILSAVVATLLLVSGWYGGELTFRHKIGIIGPGETHVS